MKKKNISRNVVIPIVVFLILIAVFFLFRFINNLVKYKIFVFNGKDYILYQESNKEWFSISKNEFIKKYKDKTYNLYVDGAEHKSLFSFDIIDDNLEMINKKNNIVTRYTDRRYFLFGGNASVNYINVKKISISSDDYKVIYNKLKKHNLEKDYNPSYLKKYAVNVDNDINTEYVYVISNMVDSDNTKVNENLDKMFSFMFLKDEKDIYDIYSSLDNSNICVPVVDSALKFESDNSYKFITYCDNIGENTSELNLYNFKNGRFSHININN